MTNLEEDFNQTAKPPEVSPSSVEPIEEKKTKRRGRPKKSDAVDEKAVTDFLNVSFQTLGNILGTFLGEHWRLDKPTPLGITEAEHLSAVWFKVGDAYGWWTDELDKRIILAMGITTTAIIFIPKIKTTIENKRKALKEDKKEDGEQEAQPTKTGDNDLRTNRGRKKPACQDAGK